MAAIDYGSTLDGLRVQPLLTFDLTPNSEITEAERLVDKINRVWNVVVYSVRPEDASFDNVILPLIRVENEASDTDGTIGHMSHVFPNPQLISGSLKARKLYLQAALARASRKDVYDLVQHVVNKDEALDPQSSF